MKYEYAVRHRWKGKDTYVYDRSLADARIRLAGFLRIYPGEDAHIVRRPAAKWEVVE